MPDAVSRNTRAPSAPEILSSFSSAPFQLSVPARHQRSEEGARHNQERAEIQKSNGGVPTVCLLVPVRYTHAHNGVMNRRDFDQTVELLVEMLQHLDAAAVQRIRDFAP